MKHTTTGYIIIFVAGFIMAAAIDYVGQRSIELALLAGTFVGSFCALCHKLFHDPISKQDWK
jgi:hypothetical protein